MLSPKIKSFISANSAIIVILVLAFSLRMLGVISRPIWYDEAFSILFSEKGLEAMLYGTLSPTGAGSADIHPLGYYAILWIWISSLGRSIFAARMLSIVISLISLVLIYQISKLLFRKRTASIAALLFAILPFQIHFAQEIRMYSLMTLWLLVSTLSFLRARAGNWEWWVLFAISCALAQYTHNLAAFYLIPLTLTPIFQRDWKTLRAITVACLFSIIIYLPWAIHLPSQFSKVSTSYWVERPGFEKIFTLFLYYLPNMPLPNNMLVPGLLIATSTISLALYQTILSRKNSVPTANRGIWLAYLAFTPPFLLWLISQYIPVYIERALLPSHAVFCIWLAWTLTHMKASRPIQTMSLLFIVISTVIGLFQHATYKDFPYGPFSEINERILNEIETGDIVVHSSKLSYLPSLYTNPNMSQGYIIDPPGSTVDTLAPATREVLQVVDFENIISATADAHRIWFIIYQKSLDEFRQAGQPHPHIQYLNDNFKLESIEEWDGLRLYIYNRNVP